MATITEWGPATTGFTIEDGIHTVTITAPGSYFFRSITDDEPDYIQLITVDPGIANGTVNITVAYDANGGIGASDVWEIDLSNATTGNLAELIISGNLATAGDVICDAITGEVDVGGTFGDGPGSTTYLLHAGTGSGNITIAGDCPGDLDLGTYSGGNITIGGLLTGDLDAGNPHDVTLAGAGEHTGNVAFNADAPYAYDLKIGDPDNSDPQNPNIMSGDIYIRYGTQGHGGDTGYIRVYGDMYGSIQIGDSGHAGGDFTYGTIVIEKSLYNDITIVGPLGTSGYVVRPAMIHVYENFSAPPGSPSAVPTIAVGGQIVGRTWGSVGNYGPSMIYIHGDMNGVIDIGDKLNNGRIYIGGALNNVVEGPEITVTNATTNSGAIVIDYDGYDVDDNWDPNAVISLASQSYTSNDLSVNIFRTSECRGDLNNDGAPDEDDLDLFSDALFEPVDFSNDFVGCEGSRVWHGDANANGAFNSADEDALEILVANECCIQVWPCPTDLDFDFDTDIDDLAALLGDYGCTEDCVGDVDGDDDVDLSDLAELLGHYGEDCDCEGDSVMESSAYVDVTVVAINTYGHTGGGFVGEVDHFVFDLQIEVSQPNSDDWLVSGAALTADNDATFRLSTYPTTPNQYATFVAAPWTTLPGSSTANVAGTYDPADPNAMFTTSEANLGWYDTDTASNDGPATVMRIVIDVSEVDGADVSGGFGSVYFSTTGPANKDDILVAELASGTGTKLTEGLKTYGGEFYVKGQ